MQSNYKNITAMAKKALLMILDGWGIGNHSKSDVIYSTPTPYWDSLLAKYPHSELQASGENVGLPDGQMGNSEVGHLNIGAGRVVYQDLVKINKACADGSILENPEIVNAFSYAKKSGNAIPASFLLIILAAIKEILSTVAVTSRRAYIFLSAGARFAVCPTMASPVLFTCFIKASSGIPV